MTVETLRLRLRHSRPLTVLEKAIAGVTVSLAVAAVVLAIAGPAGASPAGRLPADGPFWQEPARASSHAAAGPDDPAAFLGD